MSTSFVVTKKAPVLSALHVYAIIETSLQAGIIAVSSDEIVSIEVAPQRITCRSAAHYRYWLHRLDTSYGGLLVLFP